MKRIISVLLIFCIITALSSCGKEAEVTADGSSAAEQTTVALENKVRADGYYIPFLPDSFPESLPNGVDVHTTVRYTVAPEETGYDGELVRLHILCSEEGLSLLNYSLGGKGWTGGCGVFGANEASGREVNSPWAYGVWRNAEKIALLSDSVYISDNVDTPFSVTLDIFDGKKGLTRELTEYFPYIDGYSVSGGTLTCRDEDGKALLAQSGTDAPHWRWDFLTPDVFAGVTETAAEDYLDDLSNAGFTVTTEERTDSRGTIIVSTAVREVDSTEYYVEVMYFTYLKAMMISFTNDFDFFKNEK